MNMNMSACALRNDITRGTCPGLSINDSHYTNLEAIVHRNDKGESPEWIQNVLWRHQDYTAVAELNQTISSKATFKSTLKCQLGAHITRYKQIRRLE
jgi:hypothetical protein